MENGEQVVATFEFDGSVYNIQIVNKNSIVTVTTPTSTDYVIFNYCTVNGEKVDLSTYQITTNTKFVANVTHKYDVKFKVDNTDYDSQIVVKNGYATLPEEPIKAGYEFDGWSLNGVDVVENISFTAVTQNVTYQAVFTKLHTVTFTYEEELKSTQQVRNGEYATDIEVENTNYKVFNGWKVNGSFVDIESYKINADTVFVADLTYKYDVKFMVDNEEYDHQIIIENGFVNLPEIPVKDGYVFDGWSLNGVDIIKNIDTVTVNENIIYKAVFTKFYKVTFMVDNEEYVLQSVKGNNAPSIPEAPSKSGYSFEGWSIDKQNIIDVTEVLITQNTTFYAMFSYYDFVAISWNGLTSFDGSHIWTDGENTYYSNFDEQYKLNKETLTWEPFLWNGLASFGSAVFTIDKDIYLYQKNNCYKLNKETSTWEPFQSLYLDIPTFSVSNIWTDGENTYYSDFDDQYKLNKETLTWEPFSWNGLTIIDGLNIWTDGNDIYYSFLSTYKLNKETLTWEIFIYDSNFSIGGVNIWTDGKNIYHSLWENHCKLNKETLSWETITWNGLTSFEGSKIWTDGNDIYYSSGSAQYSYTKILVCF